MRFLPQAIASLWIIILFTVTGCEIYSDVLTKPEYQPTLAINAILSPQEGGDVYIKYTLPVDSTNAQPVPVLPQLSVFLYEDGEKKYTFTEQDKGHFVLDTAGLYIVPNRDYHLEVEDKDGEIILKSGKDRLPSLPDIVATRFYQDTTTFPEKNYVDVEFNLMPDLETAYHFRKDYSIDSGQFFMQGRNPEHGRFSVGELVHSADFPEGVFRKTLNAPTFGRPHPGTENEFVDAIKLWVDHLSPGLTQYLQDVADARNAYGDPFATQSPVYSNIEGGYGVFGMYQSWVDVLYLK
ncbi:DUF4249 domain-containing protein [Membranicola marinus]|uniref:DUF4249 domain-containing protein n=1 Tax=Membranihabitans marinus TaxID=1227546 RepID=A0A953L7N3_9BACT|nr:DUF4249 family protein [Membranihabitans marinus]MBY5958902.1 DUF4249 domain-containing protein [Membranihabitans marinus]